MRALVLESFVGSNYADTPDGYEFPPQYLKWFEPLSRGEPLVAVIYEPRGDRNEGRVAYVGWALLTTPPAETGKRNSRHQLLYRVAYSDRYREFDRIVPREATGEPIETWLRPFERGRLRNVATVGRAVRPLNEDDLQLIMTLGVPSGVERLNLETPETHEYAESITTAERTRRLVSAVQREAGFRDEVLVAYQHRCAVSGLSVGTSPSRAYGLLDAAHIRPVGNQGADRISNGLALTPTLHRMFDKGLFTLTYEGSNLRVRTSPQLRLEMLVGGEGFLLQLTDGLAASLPSNPDSGPSRDALDYHHSEIFLAN